MRADQEKMRKVEDLVKIIMEMEMERIRGEERRGMREGNIGNKKKKRRRAWG